MPDVSPEEVESWATRYFESRWTFHIGLGALFAAAAWFIGSSDLWWDVPPIWVSAAVGLGISGISYAIDHALERWLN